MAGSVSTDSALLAALYEEHAPGLRRFVVGVIRDRAAAEDVVQVTFARATDAAGGIPTDAMKAWLYRVAFNEAIAWKRRSEVDRKATQALGERQRGREFEGVAEPLVRRELVEEVRKALETLPAGQAAVLRARLFHEKSFAEIAAETGAPLGTVLTNMRRGLEKLRQKLNPHGE